MAAANPPLKTLQLKQDNTYPVFNNGDVEIISPSGKTWRLHSMTLGQSSSVLKEIFDNFKPLKVRAKDREIGKIIRWKLVMNHERLALPSDPNGLLYRRLRPSGNNEPLFSILDGANFNGIGATPGFDRLYDNLFRCIYKLLPNFETDSKNDQNRYILDATTLLTAASFLDARAAVSVVIEQHLLRLGQVLWFNIAQKAEGWASLGCRLRSPPIYREAMIHIIGRLDLKNENAINGDLIDRVEHGAEIYELALKKSKELKDRKLYIERRLVEFIPSQMSHTASGGYAPGRDVYSTDIYLWQALTIIRQYINSAYLSNWHHRAEDGGVRLYRSIADPESYLNGNALEEFHKHFDMSAKGKACLVTAIETIKKELATIVRPLLVDNSQAVRGRHAAPVAHLTCGIILDEELPWAKAAPSGPVFEAGGEGEDTAMKDDE